MMRLPTWVVPKERDVPWFLAMYNDFHVPKRQWNPYHDLVPRPFVSMVFPNSVDVPNAFPIHHFPFAICFSGDANVWHDFELRLWPRKCLWECAPRERVSGKSAKAKQNTDPFYPLGETRRTWRCQMVRGAKIKQKPKTIHPAIPTGSFHMQITVIATVPGKRES